DLVAQPTRQGIGELLGCGPAQVHGVDEGAQRRRPFLVGVPVVRATIAQAGEDAVVEVGEEAALRIVSLLPLWMQRRGDHGEASSFPFEALTQGRERVETVP